MDWGTWPPLASTSPEPGGLALDVLVVRAGALGDILLLRRTVAALRRAGHGVRLLAPSAPGRALVGPGAGEVSHLTSLDGPGMATWLAGASSAGDLAEELRADAVLALTRSADLLARLRTLTPRVVSQDPSPRPGRDASRWYAAPACALGADVRPDPPTLAFTAAEKGAARETAGRLPPGFLALHPGSGSAGKNWSTHGFASLVRTHAPGVRWLLVSGPADAASTAGLSTLPGALVARDLPVRVLGALLAHAGLFVGNDSGVTHLAAAAGAPTLALFGPTAARTWAPDGPLVATVSSPDGTMEGLDLPAVQEAATRLLKRGEGSARAPGD
jgi:hypothetical protein